MATKPASQKTIKSFFKLISLDLAPKVKAELERGLDPNVVFDLNGYGTQTALMYALDRQKDACVRVLLAADADVKAKGGRGDTALHEVQDVGFAKDLIERGADVNAKSASGRTPLHEACQRKDRELAALLLQHGAKVDAEDAEGRTPYAGAMDAGVRTLLKQHGAKGFGAGGGKLLKPTTSKAKWKDVSVARGALGIDREGNVWLAGYAGVFRFDGTELTRFVFEESMAFDSIGAGPDGVVFFATNWGLLRLAGGKFTLFSSKDSELFDHHIVYMRTSPDGRPHMLSYEDEAEHKHISIFDGESFTLLSPGKDFPDGLEIQCLAFDRTGKLVIGADGGLAVQRDDDWKVIEHFDREQTFAPHIYDIAVDGDTLWIGTSSGVYEYSGGQFTRHRTENLAKSVCSDGETVWIGLSYGGLGRLRGGTLTVFTEKDSALPGDDVEQVVLGKDGTLWARAREVVRVRDGELEQMSGEPPAKQPPTKQAAKRKLLPFPSKPIVARAKLPKSAVDVINQAKLASIHADQLLAVVRPAIAFDCVKYKTVDVGASKFGGRPDLPPKLLWPSFDSDEDRLLPFLLQFNLADLHPLDKEGLLPPKGMLYFFSDTSPDELTDTKVLYTGLPPGKLVRREYPEDLVDRAKQVDFIAQVPEYKVELYSVLTLPSREFLSARVEWAEDDDEGLQELRAALVKLANKKLPRECSRLLGWPDSVQGDVIESTDDIALLQLNGCELSPKGIEKVFEHWCSDGLIHFVIDAKALAKKQFDKAEGSMAYT